LSRTEVVSWKHFVLWVPLPVECIRLGSSPEGSNNFHSQPQSFPQIWVDAIECL